MSTPATTTQPAAVSSYFARPERRRTARCLYRSKYSPAATGPSTVHPVSSHECVGLMPRRRPPWSRAAPAGARVATVHLDGHTAQRLAPKQEAVALHAR
eukprot:scaffold13751_cov108-Isochrysis_galbana.AAC.13